LIVVAALLVVVGCGGPSAGRPVFFAVLADVQYADKPTAGRRHYRTALARLTECVDDLNLRDPIFTIQLGDITDGHRKAPDKSKADLRATLGVFNSLTMPKYHVIGNHCMVSGADTLKQELGVDKFYYDFTAPEAGGWRFVVLDGNDAGYGVIGPAQMKWFSATLAQAAKNGEKVICFCHFALLKAAAAHHRMSKPQPVLDVMDRSGCVVAWFAGHDHAGGYALREGVHHVTMKGIVEHPVKNAYAFIELHRDRIKKIGCGAEPDRDMPLGPPQEK
jgi:3',5'-cyclic AMP phosphodiesterase CpdA